MIVRAVIEWDDSAQSYSATCPELNFVSSCGDTKENAMPTDAGASRQRSCRIIVDDCFAIANLKDAIKLMLEPIPDELYSGDSTSEQVELVL